MTSALEAGNEDSWVVDFDSRAALNVSAINLFALAKVTMASPMTLANFGFLVPEGPAVDSSYPNLQNPSNPWIFDP